MIRRIIQQRIKHIRIIQLRQSVHMCHNRSQAIANTKDTCLSQTRARLASYKSAIEQISVIPTVGGFSGFASAPRKPRGTALENGFKSASGVASGHNKLPFRCSAAVVVIVDRARAARRRRAPKLISFGREYIDPLPVVSQKYKWKRTSAGPASSGAARRQAVRRGSSQ